MVRKTAIRRAALLMLCGLMLFLTRLPAYAGTRDLVVLNDSGNGEVFAALETNYVKIDHIGLSNAIILSGEGMKIIRGQEGSAWRSTNQLLVYEGKVRFGTSKKTSKKNAVTASNTLPAFTLKFPEGALLADGTRADVILTVEDWHVELGNSFNTRIGNATTVRVPIFISAGTDGRSLLYAVTPPKTSFDRWNYTASDYSSGAATAMRVRTNIRITECAPGSEVGTPIDAALFPSMLIGFYDLDVRDNTIRSGASYAEQYNGTYAEGVEPVSGWKSPIALAPANGSGIENRCLVNTQIRGENIRIKGDGDRFRLLERATGSTNDTNTYYSGLIASVEPQGFTHYWTGSVAGGKSYNGCMGTVLAGQPTVSVRAKRGAGGELDLSGLDRWNSTTYLMNSAASYTYRPAEGYTVKGLLVDGVEQELTDEQRTAGGSYEFERLNKYPLPQRSIRNGQVLEASESGYYTIEARFRRDPAFVVSKICDRQAVHLGSEEPVSYRILVTQIHADASGGTCLIEDDLVQGLLSPVEGSLQIEVSEGGYEILQADEDGLKIRFDTPEASGREQTMEIRYQAAVRWDRYTGGEIPNRVIAGPSEAENALEVLTDLILAKDVRGTLRDTSKRFEFTVALSGLRPETSYRLSREGGGELYRVKAGKKTADGFQADETGAANIVVRLKGGQQIRLADLPCGCSFQVTEAPSDHFASYAITGDGEDPGIVTASDANTVNRAALATAEETIDPGDGVQTVTFTNTRDTGVITGLRLPSIRQAVVLAAAGLFACSVMIVRRRRNDAGSAKPGFRDK